MLDQEILNDIELARKIISTTDSKFVVIQYGKIWKEKKTDGVKPLLETIDEMGEDLQDSIIGTKYLDKASAFLCRYAKVKGVYAPRATKTSIALLIMAGIPSEIDEMIMHIENQDENVNFFDKLLDGVESPDEAYKILKEKI